MTSENELILKQKLKSSMAYLAKVKAELKRERDFSRSVINTAPTIIMVLDIEGRLVSFNKYMEELSGYTLGEVKGKDWFTIFLPECDYEEKRNSFKKKLGTVDAKGTVNPILSKDGRTIFIEWYDKTMTDSNGKFTGLLAIGQDITERRKSETEKQKLQETIQQYAKRLEIRVKKLEKSKISLTDKEKLVFYGITANPMFNDTQQAKILNLNRSTVTAIRRRLQERGIYKLINIPNLKAIGCKALTVVYGSFKEETPHNSLLIKLPGLIFFHSTPDTFVGLIASTDLIDYQREVDPLLSKWKKSGLFRSDPIVKHFPLEFSQINQFFDFEPFLKTKYGITFNVEKPTYKTPSRELKRTMKEILYAIVRYPDASTVELAKMLRLTTVTVKKNINTLFSEGFVKQVAFINMLKLNCHLLRFSHLQYKSEPDSRLSTVKDPFLNMLNGSDWISMEVFKNYWEADEKDFDEDIFLTRPVVFNSLLEKQRQLHIDFKTITKKMLGVDDF